MGITVTSNKGGGNFEPCPEYTGRAVCVDITPLKSYETQYGIKQKFKIVFELDMLDQSRTRWLKNTEVCDMLLNHRSYGFALSKTAPVRPPGASSVRPKFLSPSFSARPAGDFRPSDEAGGARVAAGFAREPDRARPSRRATVSGERIRARNSSSALHPDDPRA